MNIETFSNAELVATYNDNAALLSEQPVKRFADRSSALKRVRAILVRVKALDKGRNGGRPVQAEEAKSDANVRARIAKQNEEPKAVLAKGIEASPNCRRAITKNKEASTERKAGGKIILKANKVVRAQLMEAAKELGGNRLLADGFADYSAFLAGYLRNTEGSVTKITLRAVKGKQTLPGTITLNCEGQTFVVEVKK